MTDFENSYASKVVDLGGSAGAFSKLLTSSSSTPPSTNFDKENEHIKQNNRTTKNTTTQFSSPSRLSSRQKWSVIHGCCTSNGRDLLGAFQGHFFASISVTEAVMLQSGSRSDTTSRTDKLLTFKSDVEVAAYCANCSCVVVGMVTGHLAFAALSNGKTIFAQKLLDSSCSSSTHMDQETDPLFSAIMVVQSNKTSAGKLSGENASGSGGLMEDILVLARNGDVIVFHQVNFQIIHRLFAAKNFKQLAAYRKKICISKFNCGIAGPRHHLNAAWTTVSTDASSSRALLSISICTSDSRAGSQIKLWRRYPTQEKANADPPTFASKFAVRQLEHDSEQMCSQSSHAGVVKMEWTDGGAWFMLLGGEGRLSWWGCTGAEGCRLIKTLDEFSGVVDFVLLSTGRREGLPRIALQKRRSSGISIQVLFLDGKKIRRGFTLQSLMPSTRLIKSSSMAAAFFTFGLQNDNLHDHLSCSFQCMCHSDPSIRMQQLHQDGGLDAAMHVADQFDINPVGFLQESLVKITEKVNMLVSRILDHNLNSKLLHNQSPTSSVSCNAARDEEEELADLMRKIADLVDKIEDDYTAIESLYNIAVERVDLIRQLHCKAADRFEVHQADPRHSDREKRRFKGLVRRLQRRWQIYERTFCGAIVCSATDVPLHEQNADADADADADVNRRFKCVTISAAEWQQFRRSKIEDMLAMLMHRGMVTQAVAIWRYFFFECCDDNSNSDYSRPSITLLLSKIHNAASLLSPCNPDVVLFADVFLDWFSNDILRRGLVTLCRENMAESGKTILNDGSLAGYTGVVADTLMELRDWIFTTAAKIQAFGTSQSARIALTLVELLDPVSFDCGDVSTRSRNIYSMSYSGLGSLGGINVAAQMRLRIQVAHVFKEPVSKHILRKSELQDTALNFSQSSISKEWSLEQLSNSLKEMVYLVDVHRMDGVFKTVDDLRVADLSAISLHMLNRADSPHDVDMQLQEHVRPFLLRHCMELQRSDSTSDRVARKVDAVLVAYVESQFAQKSRREERLEKEVAGLDFRNDEQSMTKSMMATSLSSFANHHDSSSRSKMESKMEEHRKQMGMILARIMRAIRLIEELDLKSLQAVDFLSNVRPIDFESSIFQFAEDAATWGKAHRDQLLEQRRLLDIYTILAKYGVLSGCSSWAFSVTKVTHIQQLLVFITSQINRGMDAFQDALVLVDAYPEFSKLDVFVDFINNLISQPLELPPDMQEEKKEETEIGAAGDEGCVTPKVKRGHHLEVDDDISNPLNSNSKTKRKQYRLRLARKIMKLAKEYGLSFRMSVCEEVVTFANMLLETQMRLSSSCKSTDSSDTDLKTRLHTFLLESSSPIKTNMSSYEQNLSSATVLSSKFNVSELALQVGSVMLKYLQNDRRAVIHAAVVSHGRGNSGLAAVASQWWERDCVSGDFASHDEWTNTDAIFSAREVASLRQKFAASMSLIQHFGIVIAPSSLLSGEEIGSNQSASGIDGMCYFGTNGPTFDLMTDEPLIQCLADIIAKAMRKKLSDSVVLSKPKGYQLAKLLGVPRRYLQASVAEMEAKQGKFQEATVTCIRSLDNFTEMGSTTSSSMSNALLGSNQQTGKKNNSSIESDCCNHQQWRQRTLSASDTKTLKRVALAMCSYTAANTSSFDNAECDIRANYSRGQNSSPKYACQLIEKALVGARDAELSQLLHLYRAADVVVQVFAKTTHGDYGQIWSSESSFGAQHSTVTNNKTNISRDYEKSNCLSRNYYNDSNSVLETSVALHKAVKFAMAAYTVSLTPFKSNSSVSVTVLHAVTHQLVEYLLENGAEQYALYIQSCMSCFFNDAGYFETIIKQSSVEPLVFGDSRSNVFKSLLPKMLRSSFIDASLLYGYVTSLNSHRDQRSFQSKYLKVAIKNSLCDYHRLFKLAELGYALASTDPITCSFMSSNASSSSSTSQFRDLGTSAYWWLFLYRSAGVSVDTAAFSKDAKAYICSSLIGGTTAHMQLWGRINFRSVLLLAATYGVNRDFVCLHYIEYLLSLSDARLRESKRHELVGKIIDLLLTPPSCYNQALQSEPGFDTKKYAECVGAALTSTGVYAVRSGMLIPNVQKLNSRLAKIRQLRDTIARQLPGADYKHLRHVYTVVREAELAVRELVRRCGCRWTTRATSVTDGTTSQALNDGNISDGSIEEVQHVQHKQLGWDEIRVLDALIDCRNQVQLRCAKLNSSTEPPHALKKLMCLDFHALLDNAMGILSPITTTDTVDILTDSLIWAPVVRETVSQMLLADTILRSRFEVPHGKAVGGTIGKRQTMVEHSHDIACLVEADLRRIGNSTPASCDSEHPAKFAVKRCEWVAAQCEGRLKIKALHVALDMAKVWLEYSQSKRLPDQLDAINKTKDLNVQVCHARVLRILREHVNARTLASSFEPFLDNPQRLLCMVYHVLAPTTLVPTHISHSHKQQTQLYHQHEQLQQSEQHCGHHVLDSCMVPSVDVHGIADEIAGCYGPSVRMGPLIQHLVKHWLKNGPVPPIPKKVLASLSIKEHDDNKFSSIDIAGPVSNELHGSGELSSLVSPSTETSVIHSHGDANANISTSTYLLHDEDMDESPSPFNFHKVLSMKPGHDPRSTRISYSTQDDIGSSKTISKAIRRDKCYGTSGDFTSDDLFKPTTQELQQKKHMETVARIAFVLKAPFGGSTWTLERRAQFLMKYAFRSHPTKLFQEDADKSSNNRSKPSYKACAVALHALFFISDDQMVLHRASQSLGLSLQAVTTFWQQCMYMRIFDQLQLPYNIDRLSSVSSNPVGFVRGLWRDYRHETALLPLMGRMMLDLAVFDTTLWGALLQQLHHQCMFRPLIQLLLGISDRANSSNTFKSGDLLRSSPAVQKVWTAVVQHVVNQLDFETEHESAYLDNNRDEVAFVSHQMVQLTEFGLHRSYNGVILVSMKTVSTLTEICVRQHNWSSAYRCCNAVAISVERHNNMSTLLDQHCSKSNGKHTVPIGQREYSKALLEAVVLNVVKSMVHYSRIALASSALMLTPLAQFLRHVPTHRVGPASALLLAACYRAIENVSQAAIDTSCQISCSVMQGEGNHAATEDEEVPVMLQQVAALRCHWGPYLKFTASSSLQDKNLSESAKKKILDQFFAIAVAVTVHGATSRLLVQNLNNKALVGGVIDDESSRSRHKCAIVKDTVNITSLVWNIVMKAEGSNTFMDAAGGQISKESLTFALRAVENMLGDNDVNGLPKFKKLITAFSGLMMKAFEKDTD